jgi:hypothetical protein
MCIIHKLQVRKPKFRKGERFVQSCTIKRFKSRDSSPGGLTLESMLKTGIL